MTKVFYHANHEAPALVETDFADMLFMPPRPDKTFLTKKDFVDWSSNPSTDHCFYNFFEPADPSTRVTKDNPPAFLHGLVADYDVAGLEDTAVARAIKDCPSAFPVAYVSRTFSRGIRMVWLFEKPLPVFNEEVAKGVAKRAIKELKLKKLAPGFDEEAFMDPAKFYELGTDWVAVNPDRTIPSTYLTTWAFEASQKANFVEGGKSIPLSDVAAEAERRWPGRWQGEFAEGAMGVRFWDPTATNPKGAWVRATGMQAFTGECKFLHWDVIFGKEWVAKYEAERIGSVIDGVWYDGVRYWQKNSKAQWISDTAEVFRRGLTCDGLNGEKSRGQPSEVDRALHVIEDKERRLQGAFPFLYDDKDTRVLNGKRYLNVSFIRPIQPLDGTRLWGEGFPWMASWLESMLGGEQLAVFLSWFSRTYQGALAHNPRQGHAMFLVGPTDSGKTLVASRVVGAALGGFSEATDYILGTDQFNGDMFESGVWTVDDARIASDRNRHEEYSQVVKKVVANPSMTYRRMYCDGVTLPWLGRLIVTLNMNAIEMLPNIEAELLDKVDFILVRKSATVFLGCEAKIAAELPALLTFLRDYQIPDELKDPTGDRFGFKSYHHPELLAAAKAEGPASRFAELVDEWRTHHFTFDQKATVWEGTSFQFQRELNEDGALTKLAGQTVRSTAQIGRHFSQLLAQDTPWLSFKQSNKGRVFIIKKP